MSSTTKKWLARISVSLLVLCLIGSGYAIYQLDLERKNQHKEIEALNTRNNLLQKKYNEQKALTAAMLREKQQVESRARDLEFQLAKAQEDEKKAEEVAAALEQKIEKMQAEQEELIAAHVQRFDELKTAFDALREESNRIILEKNQEITQIKGQNEALNASLEQETFQHKRCREHNGRLAVLADELIDLYDNKGTLTKLGQIEPFTKLKRVEVEKLCQQYRDKVDENALEGL